MLIWALEPEVAYGIAHDNENRPYLPRVKLDPAIRATNDLGDVAAADIVLLAAPAQHFRHRRAARGSACTVDPAHHLFERY